MPQLLNYLYNNSNVSFDNQLDWATLLIYTCPNSCISNLNHSFIEETIFKIDYE